MSRYYLHNQKKKKKSLLKKWYLKKKTHTKVKLYDKIVTIKVSLRYSIESSEDSEMLPKRDLQNNTSNTQYNRNLRIVKTCSISSIFQENLVQQNLVSLESSE